LDRANAIRTAILQAEIVAYEIDADAEDGNVISNSRRSINPSHYATRPTSVA
jgi:hypothetical protein